MGNFFPADEIAKAAPRSSPPWTICVLFYGDHPELCARFLEKLYRFTDPALFQLRAGLNEVCDETAELVSRYGEEHGNISVHRERKNIYKCPMMRKLFHQPAIETEWTIWFDDDSYVRNPCWAKDLAMAIQHHAEAELFGSVRVVEVSPHLEEWIQKATWYRGVPRWLRPDILEPFIRFPVGGFWVVRSERIRQIDWPDRRLKHRQTDYTMGEALRQQGVKIANFESGVCIDDAPTREPKGTPFQIPIDYPDLE